MRRWLPAVLLVLLPSLSLAQSASPAKLPEKLGDPNATVQEMEGLLKRLAVELAIKDRLLSDLRKQMEAELTTIKAEAMRVRDDLAAKEAMLKENVTLKEEIAALRATINSQRIAEQSIREQNRKLLQRVAELEKLTTEMKGRVEVIKPAVATEPAVVRLRGRITEIGDKTIATINLGADAGVKEGMKFDIYRLDSMNPKNSRYVGQITIVKVSPTASAGQVKLVGTVGIQLGDEVATAEK